MNRPKKEQYDAPHGLHCLFLTTAMSFRPCPSCSRGGIACSVNELVEEELNGSKHTLAGLLSTGMFLSPKLVETNFLYMFQPVETNSLS
jgi:hypothetical protein